MARNEHSPAKFERLAADLSEAANVLSALAQAMDEGEMPHALVHSATVMTIHVPAVLEWVGKTNADVRNQLRSYLDGVQSRAEFQKEKSARVKVSAAKKPFTPKAAKKKAT